MEKKVVIRLDLLTVTCPLKIVYLKMVEFVVIKFGGRIGSVRSVRSVLVACGGNLYEDSESR